MQRDESRKQINDRELTGRVGSASICHQQQFHVSWTRRSPAPQHSIDRPSATILQYLDCRAWSGFAIPGGSTDLNPPSPHRPSLTIIPCTRLAPSPATQHPSPRYVRIGANSLPSPPPQSVTMRSYPSLSGVSYNSAGCYLRSHLTRMRVSIIPSTVSRYNLSLRTMATAKNNPLFNAVADDHQEMYEYYDSYLRAAGNPELQTKWSNQLRWEIARHAVGEEIVIYPLMERYLGEEGVRLADHDRDEHQVRSSPYFPLPSSFALSLFSLSSKKNYTPSSPSPRATPSYDALLKSIMDHLHEHNDSEEVNDLPQLFEKIGREGAEEAAREFKRTKKFAPT
ncbi:hypothetical protein NMY22_g13839 [Coprinellus aureogranulatus]|nr:hypothetical protein NMY22_g13839 [Coprinellus aureogranulatus]